MTRELLIKIQCGKSTCIDAKTGQTCDDVYQNMTETFCALFKDVVLEKTNYGNYKRCKACLKAEKRFKAMGLISLQEASKL